MKKWLLSAAGMLLLAALVLFGLAGREPSYRPPDYQMHELPDPDDHGTLVLAERVSDCETSVMPYAAYYGYDSSYKRYIFASSSDWRITEVYLGDPLLKGQTVTLYEELYLARSERKAQKRGARRAPVLGAQTRILIESWFTPDFPSADWSFATVEPDGTVHSETGVQTTLAQLSQADWEPNVYYLRWNGALYRHVSHERPEDGNPEKLDLTLTYCQEPLPSQNGMCNLPQCVYFRSFHRSRDGRSLYVTMHTDPLAYGPGIVRWYCWERVD